jgi:hypothetical protein
MCVCHECQEDWLEAMHQESGLCRNHAVLTGVSDEPYCRIIPHCPTCGRRDVPAQWHHPATERQQIKHVALKHLGILVCLNCHGILTERQCKAWDQGWRKEDRPVVCTVQGTYDVVWLWWMRSGRLWWEQQCGELAHLVLIVLLGLLQYVGLRGGEVVL